ncbi:MAG: septum site-determining protein MinC [Gammaproteobacteria bacterium]|nr:septum site-determining protein MinC [Gammaproteobacteria bacterium]
MSVGVAAEAPAFQFKGSMLPFTVMELETRDLARIEAELPDKLAQAPGFFEYAALVLGVEKVTGEALDVAAIVDMLRAHRLLPIAVRGGDEAICDQARGIGLAWFPAQSDTAARRPASIRRERSAPAKTPAIVGKTYRGTVRSGQQVAALDGDLIIVGAVNSGAEVLAAGSVHVYGALRGRALAGIHGDGSAAIFCRELEAELLSIAGAYKRREDMEPALIGRSVQVRLSDEQLQVLTLD